MSETESRVKTKKERNILRILLGNLDEHISKILFIRISAMPL